MKSDLHDDRDSLTRLRHSTFGFAILTMVSRIFGMIREIAATAALGVSGVMSSFTVAFQIPNVIRSFIADMAVSTSLVPAISPLIAEGERERASRVAAAVGLLTVSAMSLFALAAFMFAPIIIEQSVGDSFESTLLTIELFKILIWILPLMAGAGIIIGILNANNHFALPASAPIAWNLIVIIALIVAYLGFDLSQREIVFIYAWAVVLGTVVQMLLPMIARRTVHFRLFFSPAVLMHTIRHDPLVKLIVIGIIPVALTLALTNLAVLVNLIIATRVESLVPFDDAGPAILDKAWRVYMLPQGAFTLAVGTVFFPRLSRYAASMDIAQFKATIRYCMIILGIVLLPIATIGFVLAEPSTAFLFQRGAFGPEYVPYVARSLKAFLLGLIWQGWAVLCVKALFALNYRWTPALIGAIALAVNTMTALALYPIFGLMGIALAMGISQAAIVLMAWIVLRRQAMTPASSPIIIRTTIIGIAALVAAAVAELLRMWTSGFLPGSTIGNGVLLVICATPALAVYVGILLRLKIIRNISSLLGKPR